MNSHLKKSLKYAVIYLITLLVLSSISIEVFINAMPEDMKSSARMSALFSMFFSVTFQWMTIVLALTIHWLFIKQALSKINDSIAFDGYENVLFVFILTEYFKFSLVWIFLVEEVKLLDFKSIDLSNQIESSSFGTIGKLSESISIWASSVIYGATLKMNGEKLISLVATSVILLVVLMIGEYV